MSAKSMMIAAATAAVMLAGTAGMASAHGKNHHNFFFKNHHPRVIFLLGNTGGCGYYRDMWYDTGSFYWKSKYYHCKGWW